MSIVHTLCKLTSSKIACTFEKTSVFARPNILSQVENLADIFLKKKINKHPSVHIGKIRISNGLLLTLVQCLANE